MAGYINFSFKDHEYELIAPVVAATGGSLTQWVRATCLAAARAASPAAPKPSARAAKIDMAQAEVLECTTRGACNRLIESYGLVGATATAIRMLWKQSANGQAWYAAYERHPGEGGDSCDDMEPAEIIAAGEAFDAEAKRVLNMHTARAAALLTPRPAITEDNPHGLPLLPPTQTRFE